MVVEITFDEVLEFTSNNGYVLAVYRKQTTDGNWHLTDETGDTEVVPSDTILLANKNKTQTNMNETVTKDKQILFKLHNNFNIPSIIPCFSR